MLSSPSYFLMFSLYSDLLQTVTVVRMNAVGSVCETVQACLRMWSHELQGALMSASQMQAHVYHTSTICIPTFPF